MQVVSNNNGEKIIENLSPKDHVNRQLSQIQNNCLVES